MPNLKDIRRRIGSIEKTQQITRAMRMVSAAKLRRAQAAIEAARPYAERMRRTLAEVAAAQVDVAHPLLEPREQPKHLELVVISSDRGLAGAFNSNVMKCADAFLERNRSRFERVSLSPIGRMASEHYRRRSPQQVAFATNIGGWVSYAGAAEIARRLADRYQQREVDQVVVVHNEFISTMTQTPREIPLLPVAPAEAAAAPLPYSIEPSAEVLLGRLVPKAVEVELFRALLESQAGEHAARMTAMESATRNTEELIDKLRLDYNRARQAAITSELVEIVTGAQALEG